jgi:hypothetical protein
LKSGHLLRGLELSDLLTHEVNCIHDVLHLVFSFYIILVDDISVYIDEASGSFKDRNNKLLLLKVGLMVVLGIEEDSRCLSLVDVLAA